MANTNKQNQLERNMLAKFTYVAQQLAGMTVEATAQGVLINTNLACDMFNIIAALQVNAAAELETLFETFTKQHLPFALWTGFANQTSATQQALTAFDLPEVEKEVGMFADIVNLKAPKINPELIIERVTTEKQLDDLVTVIIELLPQDATAIRDYFAAASDILLARENKLIFFVGYLENKPVATSSLYQDDHSAGIWDIITLPIARRRGIGTTMTYAMAMQAKSVGYETVVLTASDEGLPVYEKIGFTRLGEFVVYNFTPS